MKRKPAVAGQFYSASSSGLAEEVQKYIDESAQKEKAIGIVCPHAGLVYSGFVAGLVYSKIKFPQTFILIGPNHTGIGKPVSIMTSGEWEIPSGSVKIDDAVANKILEISDVIEEDGSAHVMEHSLEVQLPFIRHFSPDARIVPITMMTGSLESCRLVGDAVAEAVKGAGYDVTVVASSDMSHYETDQSARSKDRMAIDTILSLAPEELYETVTGEGISMCGFIPVIAMLFASEKLGATRAVLVKYMTSGEINGDFERVVGYAGIMVK
jgi:AmmeMemoRadiSam system protein B